MTGSRSSEDVLARARQCSAFAVHVVTACGAALALLALMAAAERAWSTMFFWLGLALAIDGLDGPLARRFEVAAALPRWSGDTLDLIVDFATYVFVPAFAIAHSGALPQMLAAPAGVAIVVTGAIYFADRRMKTADHYFRGFPALWNVAAFYLVLLMPPPALASMFVAALAILTFVPFPFIHPLRVARWRPLNIALLAAWGALALIAVARDMAPGPWVTGALCAIGLYMIAAGLFRRLTAADA